MQRRRARHGLTPDRTTAARRARARLDLHGMREDLADALRRRRGDRSDRGEAAVERLARAKSFVRHQGRRRTCGHHVPRAPALGVVPQGQA
jgi:hypothetical protein